MAETIFVASGEVTPELKAEVLQSLTGFGLSAYVVPPSEKDAIVEPALMGYFPFVELTSPEQFLGKEHVHQYAERFMAKDTNKRTATKAFTLLVQPRYKAKQGQAIGARIPTEVTGLEYRTRRELDFPRLETKYGSQTVDEDILETGVQAGSALRFIAMVGAKYRPKDLKHLKTPGSKVFALLEGMAAQLQTQFE